MPQQPSAVTRGGDDSGAVPDGGAAVLFAGPGEMRARCRAFDWAATPLGPVDRWPATLRTVARLALAASLPTLVRWGPERMQLYNDAFARVLGAGHPSALGRGEREASREWWDGDTSLYARVFAGETVTTEAPGTREAAHARIGRAGAPEHAGEADGPGRGDAPRTISYVPIQDDAGAVAGVLVTALETTPPDREDGAVAALRARERRHAFLATLADALRTVADPVQVQAVATRTLGEHLGVNHAYYVSVDADDAHVTCEADYVRGMPSLVGRYPLAAYGPTLAAEYRAGRPVVIGDTRDDPLVPAPLRAAWEAIGIRAQLAVPLVKDGRFTAALGVDQAVPRAWTAEELTLVQETAERTWGAVERARAEALARDRLAELESVYQAAPVGMCVFDRELRYVRINERLAEMNGLPCEAHLGRTVRELLPDLADTAEATLRHILETGSALRDVEFRGTTPAQPGVERVWLEQWLPLYDAAGAIVGVHVVAEEVTEQRRLVAQREAALAAERGARDAADLERRRLLAVLEQLPVGVHVAEAPSGRLILDNAAIREICGQAPQSSRVADYSVDYAGYRPAGHPQGGERVRSDEWPLARVLATGAPVRDELIEIRRADGTERLVSISGTPVRDADGRVVGGVATSVDVTERVRLLASEREARRAAEDLAERLTARETFLRQVTDVAPSILYVYDLVERRTLWANAGVTTVLGYAIDEVHAMGERVLPTLIHPEDWPAYVAHAERLARLTEGEVATFTYRMRRRGDDVPGDPSSESPDPWRWIESRDMAFARAADGRVTQIVGAATDVTERTRAEDEIRRSTTLLRAISESTGDVIYAKDRAGRLTYGNPATFALIGKPPEAVLGRTDAEVLNDPEAARRVMVNDRRIMATGEAEELEEVVPLPDGTQRVWASLKMPYRDHTGAVVGLLGVSRDVTDRVEARRRLAAALTAGEVGAFEWDIVRDRLYGDENFARLFGIALDPDGAAPIETYLAAIHPEDRPLVEARLAHVLAVDASYEAEYRIVGRTAGSPAIDGVAGSANEPVAGPLAPDSASPRWVIARGRVERDAVTGRPLRFPGTILDITARKRAEDALALREAEAEAARRLAERERERADEARRAAETANAAKGHFLASMSHELRTPLNAIQGYVQLLQLELHGPLTEAQRESLDRVARAQTRLLGLINDLLNYAKLEAGRVEFDVHPVPVADVIADVVPLVEPQLAAKGLRLSVTLQERRTTAAGGPAMVRADREKLGQVLLNLLTNAVKFTPASQRDGTPGHITVRLLTREDGPSDRVYLQVADTGIGIPREKQEAIFDPFVQISTGLTRTTEGTGLGLAISRDLARGMGGDLRVRSRPGAGSTFTLTLPSV